MWCVRREVKRVDWAARMPRPCYIRQGEMRVIEVSMGWLRVSGMHAHHWSGKNGGRQIIQIFSITERGVQ
jgi:hypothetical protein